MTQNLFYDLPNDLIEKIMYHKKELEDIHETKRKHHELMKDIALGAYLFNYDRKIYHDGDETYEDIINENIRVIINNNVNHHDKLKDYLWINEYRQNYTWYFIENYQLFPLPSDMEHIEPLLEYMCSFHDTLTNNYQTRIINKYYQDDETDSVNGLVLLDSDEDDDDEGDLVLLDSVDDDDDREYGNWYLVFG